MGERIKSFLLRCCRAVRIHPGVASGSAAFYIGGLLVTDPALQWVALLSYGVGTVLLLWGGRIHGLHLWQPWWRGRPSPFNIAAGVDRFDYEHGSTVAGIPWEQGFSHVWVRITNESLNSLDFDALLSPQHPIVHSRAACPFAECHIAPTHGQPQVTLVLKLPDGRTVAKHQEANQGGNYTIDPVHRLHCAKLPGGATIEVDLATVVPEQGPTPIGPWKRERSDPEGIRVRVIWAEDGGTYVADQILELKGVPHD